MLSFEDLSGHSSNSSKIRKYSNLGERHMMEAIPIYRVRISVNISYS